MSPIPSVLTDSEFLKAFENASLAKRACWDHPSHIRMAWLYLRRHPYELALAKIRRGIQRFNAATGRRGGYHDTVTQAFALLIADHLRQTGGKLSWNAFRARCADLLDKKNPALGRHYQKRTLDSKRARDGFVKPDLKPLPPLTRVRLAAPRDAAEISRIYAHYVRRTSITFDLRAPSAQEFSKKIKDTLLRHPWLVYESGGRVLGYAYAGPHRERPAYLWAVTLSVYVDPVCRGRGIGRSLYAALLECLRLQGFTTAHGGITLPNPISVKLHESFGFKHVGVYKNVGFKLGRWHDTGWWQRPLAKPSLQPKEPLSPNQAAQTPDWNLALLQRPH